MYNTILVPIDRLHLTEGKSIVDVALERASENTRIVLLNVVEEVPSWAALQIPDEIINNNLRESRAELESIARASGRKIEVEVRNGHAHNTILDVAEEIGADLIIIASHRPGLQDYFLGSTAARVVRHAKCSVLVVR